MKMKKVKFLGAPGFEYKGSGNYIGNPAQLVVGEVYTLRYKVVHSCYTEYFLEEFPGTFDSLWFEEIEDITTGVDV